MTWQTRGRTCGRRTTTRLLSRDVAEEFPPDIRLPQRALQRGDERPRERRLLRHVQPAQRDVYQYHPAHELWGVHRELQPRDAADGVAEDERGAADDLNGSRLKVRATSERNVGVES
jgi:hypothetical protein|eukprot:29029-Pelagococcus_subviridis.AAC.3